MRSEDYIELLFFSLPNAAEMWQSNVLFCLRLFHASLTCGIMYFCWTLSYAVKMVYRVFLLWSSKRKQHVVNCTLFFFFALCFYSFLKSKILFVFYPPENGGRARKEYVKGRTAQVTQLRLRWFGHERRGEAGNIGGRMPEMGGHTC